MPFHLGYCCINQTLRNSNPSVYSSRGIIRKNFSIDEAARRGFQNVCDILTILKWNQSNNIKCFRIGSEPLPRSGDREVGYSISELPNKLEIVNLLNEIGKYAVANKHMLSFHPGQYVCLGSPSSDVVDLGIYALERENEVADAIGNSLDIPINIHIGGGYGDLPSTAKRFCQSFKRLSKSLQSRITIENDDKAACWGVSDLYNYIYQEIGTPICFDIHHWHFNHTEKTMFDDFVLANSTWKSRSMQVHYSESQNKTKMVTSHSDYYCNSMPDWIKNYNVHAHLECKTKELALLKYRLDFPYFSDIIGKQEPCHELELQTC